jgi:hypothetical protein
MEPLLIATIQEPEKLSRLIQFSTELTWAILERILDHPDIPGANFSDPVASGDVVSPLTFRKFSAPAIKELVKVKAKKEYSMVHFRVTPPRSSRRPGIRPHCFSLKIKWTRCQGGPGKSRLETSPTGAFLSGRPDQVRKEAQAAWTPGEMRVTF